MRLCNVPEMLCDFDFDVDVSGRGRAIDWSDDERCAEGASTK